jgi:hypothetical protein
MAERKPGTFAKGDPRINRKGRPQNFDAARELGLQIANEVVTNANGEPALLNGRKITRIELILRTWAQSKDPRLQLAFVELTFGKTPTQQQTEITGTLKIDDLRKLSDDELRAIVES